MEHNPTKIISTAPTSKEEMCLPPGECEGLPHYFENISTFYRSVEKGDIEAIRASLPLPTVNEFIALQKERQSDLGEKIERDIQKFPKEAAELDTLIAELNSSGNEHIKNVLEKFRKFFNR